MPVANVGSKWSDGKLVFFNKATGTEILTIDSDGDIELGTEQCIAGQYFTVSFPNIAQTDVAKAFFVAPAPCTLVSAIETHGTVCDAGDTLTIEKCNTGEDAGAGDVMLAAAWTMNSTANTPVSKAALTTAAASMVAGDTMMLKFASGDGTNYAEGCVTCLLKWL